VTEPIVLVNYRLKIFRYGPIYTKNCESESVGPHFKARTVKFGVSVRTIRDSLPSQILCKKSLTGVYLFGQIYTKNYQFRRFLELRDKPTF